MMMMIVIIRACFALCKQRRKKDAKVASRLARREPMNQFEVDQPSYHANYLAAKRANCLAAVSSRRSGLQGDSDPQDWQPLGLSWPQQKPKLTTTVSLEHPANREWNLQENSIPIFKFFDAPVCCCCCLVDVAIVVV